MGNLFKNKSCGYCKWWLGISMDNLIEFVTGDEMGRKRQVFFVPTMWMLTNEIGGPCPAQITSITIIAYADTTKWKWPKIGNKGPPLITISYELWNANRGECF